jgi:hypothetical protein
MVDKGIRRRIGEVVMDTFSGVSISTITGITLEINRDGTIQAEVGTNSVFAPMGTQPARSSIDADLLQQTVQAVVAAVTAAQKST